MGLNIPIKLKNFILLLIFFSISILCSMEFFCSTMLIIFPYFTCQFEDTLGYYLYQSSEIYRFLHNNREITTCILGCLYFLLFRVYLFQKWISIIENKCQGLFLCDFLKGLRENKQILLYVNIIFLFFLFIMINFYKDALSISGFFVTIFFIPFHYLILYIRWAIKDKNKQIRSKKYHIIQYINFFVISNIQIIFYPIYIGLCLLVVTTNISKFLCCVLLLLILFYIIGFVINCIKYNIKLLICMLIVIILVPFFLLILDLVFGTNAVYRMLCVICLLFLVVTFLIGIISSIFINKIEKIFIYK